MDRPVGYTPNRKTCWWQQPRKGPTYILTCGSWSWKCLCQCHAAHACVRVTWQCFFAHWHLTSVRFSSTSKSITRFIMPNIPNPQWWSTRRARKQHATGTDWHQTSPAASRNPIRQWLRGAWKPWKRSKEEKKWTHAARENGKCT